MIDEPERLLEDGALRRLLAHYVEAGADDREAWRDRLMALEGVPPQALVRLHGELLAYGWAELKVGALPGSPKGGVPQCYRATSAGRRAMREAGAEPGLNGRTKAEAA